MVLFPSIVQNIALNIDVCVISREFFIEARLTPAPLS